MSNGRGGDGIPRIPGETRLDGGGGDPPATRLEGRAPTQADPGVRGPTRVNLFHVLTARFETVEDIGRRGAEADLLLVMERASGDRRVVKQYRQRTRGLDQEMLERVRRADRAHVVEVVDSGEVEDGPDHGLRWEVLEYCEHGSFEDLLEGDSEGLESRDYREQLAARVLREVGPALDHIHELGFVHRDIKPANILVRTLDPFDLVLADFGLATVLKASRHFGTSSRTVAYAAPEAAWGAFQRTSDWWSLGVILVEILTGRHPFGLPDGTLAPEAQINNELATRGVDLGSVEDERFKLLCRGLLTRDPEHRWGGRKVAAWEDGESPAVLSDEYAPPSGPRRKRVAPFPFRDPETGREREFTDPVALANAFASDWDAAAEIVEGRDRRQLRTLRDFLESCDFENAERLLADDDPPEATLVRLLVGLDPDIPPTFRGLSVSREGLRRLSAEAVTNDGRAATLTAIYEGRVLRHYAREDGERADYASIDTAWHRNSRTLESYLERMRSFLPSGALPRIMSVARARILSAQLDPEQMDALQQEAAAARADREARAQPWFEEIADARSEDGIAELLVAVLLQQEAAARTRASAEEQRQAAATRERERLGAAAARDRARQDAQRRTLSRLTRLTLEGLVVGGVAWLPWWGATELFKWSDLVGPSLALCLVGGVVYRLATTQDAWIPDVRAWHGGTPDPAPRMIPDLEIGLLVPVSLMVLVLAGVVRGCGALAERAEDAEDAQQENRTREPPPSRYLVTAGEFGRLSVGMNEQAVRRLLGKPSSIDLWGQNERYDPRIDDGQAPTYRRLTFRERRSRTVVFICLSSGNSTLVWSDNPKYRDGSGWGVGTPVETLRESDDTSEVSLLTRGYYTYWAMPSRGDGRMGCKRFGQPRLAYGFLDAGLDALAVGFINQPPIISMKP